MSPIASAQALARLAAEPGWTPLALSALAQITVVVLVAALLAGTALRHHAAARHALWLGALLWVLFSPLVAAIAPRAAHVRGAGAAARRARERSS